MAAPIIAKELQQSFRKALDHAKEMRHEYLTLEHVLHALTSDPRGVEILEGCGALNPASARLADVRVWVESPTPSRKRRALERDGEGFRPHWDRWAAQEDRHIHRHAPQELATMTVALP